MATYRLTVDPDGRVTIPDTHPGQTVTVQVAEVENERAPLTLATARTDEERAIVVEEITRLAWVLRRELNLGDVLLSQTHGDELYDERGLPK